MNRNPASSTAPAKPARGGAGVVRPVESFIVALLCLLAALFPGWGRPRARAATPEQHRRALRQLRALGISHPLPARAHPFRPSRRARRRAAACWRLLISRPRRRATHPRPASSRRPSLARPPLFRRLPHARAGPSPPPDIALARASPPHALIVPVSKY
jgi:hypothetical protein